MINSKAREASKQEGCPVAAFEEPVYDSGGRLIRGGYAGFGWEGNTVDRAVHADNLEALKWCVEHNLVDRDTKTLFDTPLRRLCVEKGAKRCEKYLAGLGYPA